MKNIYSKSAFTMLELIFVIIILGIVSSIGASLIAKVYENYIIQRALHTASSKTDLAAKQIAARLTYRMSLSMIGRKPSNGHYDIIENLDPTAGYNILEWIGYDNDSFAATATPGWSGFCDISHASTTKTTLLTPASNLANVSTIISNLGGDMASNPTDAAIIFNSRFYTSTQPYHPVTMGFGSPLFDGVAPAIATPTISKVSSFNAVNHIINVSDNNAKEIHDQYKLIWSAYAIVPVQQTDNPDTTVDESKLFDLELHYNYQPWNGIQYDNAATKVSTLVKDVTVFKFRGVGDTIRFKICVQEKISGDATVNACKEKAVIR